MHNPFNTGEYYEYSKKPIISPLDFDYIPSDDSEPDREMADGGTIPFSHLSLEENAPIDDLVQRKLEEEDRKFNVQQAIGIEGPGDVGMEGSESAGPSQGAAPATGGVGTFASMMQGIEDLRSEVPMGILGMARGFFDYMDAVYSEPDELSLDETTEALGKESFGVADQSTDAASQSQAMSDISMDDAISVAASDAVSESTDDGDTGAGEHAGGQIKGYQEGDMVEEQADTTMDTAGLGPMGLVDDMGGDQVTGVADDLEMDTEEGAYVLNADTVELVGLKDLNNLVKEAIDVAIGSDIPLPKKIDPTKKVPIKISNGEFIIPAILVPIIGLENLEKMNKRGLAYREKKKEQEAPAEVPTEIAEEQAPMETAPEGIINLAEGGSLQMTKLLNKEIGT